MPALSENDSSSAEVPSRRRSHTLLLCCTAASLLILVMAAVSLFRHEASVSNERMVEAEMASAAGDCRTALRLAAEILRQQPQNLRARLVTAKCLDAQNRPLKALEMLTGLPFGQPPLSVEAA